MKKIETNEEQTKIQIEAKYVIYAGYIMLLFADIVIGLFITKYQLIYLFTNIRDFSFYNMTNSSFDLRMTADIYAFNSFEIVILAINVLLLWFLEMFAIGVGFAEMKLKQQKVIK